MFEDHSPIRDAGKVPDAVFRRLVRHRCFKRLVVITHSLKHYYMKEYGLPSELIVVIPDVASEPRSGDSLAA